MESHKNDETFNCLNPNRSFSKMTASTFNKLFASITPKIKIDKNQFLNETLNLLKNILNQIKVYSNNVEEPITMLSLNHYIVEFISAIKNKNINHQMIITIISKMISILIYSLLISETSEISNILQTIFTLTFNINYFNEEHIIKIINKLFKIIEPNGSTKILNPLSIEIMKLNVHDKNNYIRFILEHIYHSCMLNENIITLMTSIVEFPNETNRYMDSFCCEYSFDFTIYLFCNFLLYYQFLTIKQNYKERNECIGILNQLVNKMIGDIVNIDNCLYCEKIEFSIILLIIHKKEINWNKEDQEDLLMQKLIENNHKIDTFLHYFLNMIDIDLLYDMLKNYLTDIIGNLSNRLNIILKYETTRIIKYKQKELWEEKLPLLCLYLNILENVSNNNDIQISSSNLKTISDLFNSVAEFKNNNNEKQILHYVPFTKNENNQTSKQYLSLLNDNHIDSKNNYDIENKKYLLKEVLNNLLSLLQILNPNKIKKKKTKSIYQFFQYITLCFNRIVKTMKRVEYEDVILNFLITYINYYKSLIITEWESIFEIIRFFYSINHEFTNEIKAIINQIEELKYSNNFNGNTVSLKELLMYIDDPSCNLFFLILFFENPEKNEPKLINNLNYLFSLIFINSHEDNSKENNNCILNEIITQKQFKVIYNVLLKTFYDKQIKEAYLNSNSLNDQNKISNFLNIKQILTKNISKLMELLVNNQNKQSFMHDLLLFVVDLVVISNDLEFNTNILNEIFVHAEKFKSTYNIVLPFFLAHFSKSPEITPKLQILFDIIEIRLKIIIKFPNEITNDFSGIYIDFLCNNKVLNDYQIENSFITVKKPSEPNNDSVSSAYLNTGIIMDYLIVSLDKFSKQSNDTLTLDMINKIKAGIMMLLSTNVLILKGMNFSLYFELMEQLLETVITYVQKETCSGKRASFLIKNELYYYLYFISNIAFHLDIENSNMKCTLALSDGIFEYSTLKFEIIKNLLKKLDFLANHIFVKNKQIENKLKKDNTITKTSLNYYNKSGENVKGFVKIFSVLEIYLFSINCNKNNFDTIKNDSLYSVLKSVIDICAKLVCLIKYFHSSFSLRFLVYKFFFMTKEIFSLYDDISLYVIFLIFNLSNKNDLTKSLRNNATIASFFDERFIQRMSYIPSQLSNDNINNNKNHKKEFNLSKTLFLEVSFDYLINYFVINAKNKHIFYTYFMQLFKALSDNNNFNSLVNDNNLLDMKYIRQKIFFENVRWCLGSDTIRDNIVKPNYKKYDKKQTYPSFYIDKETYGLLLSYEKDLKNNKYIINIRTAVSNIQHSITYDLLSNDNELNNLNNYVISLFSQINSNISLQKITIDKEFISLLNSLDSLSVYRNVHCKIFFRNISFLNGKRQIIREQEISENFLSFLNALGTLEKSSSINKATIVTSYDINNQIQFEYMETNRSIVTKVENRVTIIWCNTADINLNHELISSINDVNEFYIILYPVSNSHFLVKIENALNINIEIFNNLFQTENVIYIGEKYDMLVEYISKMVLLLNLFSRLNEFDEKHKKAEDEMDDTFEYVLHNNDNLFQRFLQINTIENKYKKK